MEYELIHTANGTTIITVSVPTHKHAEVLKAIQKVLKEPDADWFRELKDVYEDRYEGAGGIRVLAQDLGVTAATICNWRHWPKPRSSDGKIIEPTHQNRQTITALWRQHFDQSKLTPGDKQLLTEARAITNERHRRSKKKPVDGDG